MSEPRPAVGQQEQDPAALHVVVGARLVEHSECGLVVRDLLLPRQSVAGPLGGGHRPLDRLLGPGKVAGLEVMVCHGGGERIVERLQGLADP